MGFFLDKLFGRSQKEDPVITAFRSLGSKDEEIRHKAGKVILKIGPAVLPTLFAIIESRKIEKEWLETERMLEQLNYSISSGIRGLISDLNSGTAKRVKSAKKRLKAMPPHGKNMIEAIAELEKFKEVSKIQKESAIKLLTEMVLPTYLSGEAIQILIKAAVDNSSGAAVPAKNALKHFGRLGEPYLASALKNAGSSQKPTILNMLEASEPRSKETCQVLMGLLSDSSAEVRSAVISILRKMKGMSKEDLPVLVRLLAQGLNHSEIQVKLALAEILGGIGPEAAGALQDLYRLLRGGGNSVKSAAAKAIFAIKPDKEGIPVLMDSLSEDSFQIYDYITPSLASLGKPVIPFLVDKMKSGDEVAKRNTINTLGLMASEASEVLPVLESLLEEKNKILQQKVIDAIGNFGATAGYLSPKLINIWKQSGANNAMYTLCKLKEPIAIDMLLRSAFDSPRLAVTDRTRESLMEFLNCSQLTEKVISFALEASTFEHKRNGVRYDAGYISLDKSNYAIRSIINIKSAVTSNILHLISNKKDISINMDNGCGTSWDEHVNFQKQRNMALEELRLRGNPVYDYQLFITAEASEAGK